MIPVTFINLKINNAKQVPINQISDFKSRISDLKKIVNPINRKFIKLFPPFLVSYLTLLSYPFIGLNHYFCAVYGNHYLFI